MISLTAEQKNLTGIYSSNELYIVPPYQRPYSWTFDQCADLFRDIMAAFDTVEPYFLGNVILARGEEYKFNSQSLIIDGQQRLITLWTLIKVLSELLPTVNTLKTALYITPWSGDEREPKVQSKIFESNDNDKILEVFSYTKEDIQQRYTSLIQRYSILREDRCRSKIEASLLYFYEQISNSKILASGDRLMDFSRFLMTEVFLLPIVLTADNQDKATDRALSIFETINNRGLDLEDADIFKARLYGSADTEEGKSEFIQLWGDFKAECTTLGLTIDDIFRYYSHIIRGQVGITTREKRLRDFFTNESFSPLNYNTYSSVLEDLNRILSSIKYVKAIAGVGDPSSPGPWIQILREYTNLYPMYAVVVYLFNHDSQTGDGNRKFVSFLKDLVRYCLISGSTSSIKFGIYSIIKKISTDDEIEDFVPTDITSDTFDHLGRLKNCFALLAYILETGEAIPVQYSIDKIVNLRDQASLGDDWSHESLGYICNSIGNLVVLDIPKRYNFLQDKANQYQGSGSEYVRSIFRDSRFEYEDWRRRHDRYKGILSNFFNGEPR